MTDKHNPITLKGQDTSVEIDFSHRVHIPRDVIMRELDREAVILNLESEMYFGLDDVGSRMWTLMTESMSIHDAFETLRGEYDVEEERLRDDLLKLLGQLIDNGLLVLKDVEAV
jgi:hypothetical protein